MHRHSHTGGPHRPGPLRRDRCPVESAGRVSALQQGAGRRDRTRVRSSVGVVKTRTLTLALAVVVLTTSLVALTVWRL
jgi:hypothetical protein